ncbi:MAG: PHP domain-containing protein [Syntrophobacteraceae bacterium]
MLTFARNKLVSVAALDLETLSIHAVLDDDAYGLEIDLRVSIGERKILDIFGKWNRWTTPECYRALPFLQEIKGERLDEALGERVAKNLARKGCRHFANLFLECCDAATQALRVIRWENERVSRPGLSLEAFLKEEGGRDRIVEKTDTSERLTTPLPSHQSAGERSNVEDNRKDRLSRAGEDRRQGFIIDLHTHTFPASSCSSVCADELIEEAKLIGLNGICLTDHNHVWSIAQVEALRQKHGFAVFRGNEITTNQGDMLVFGLEKDIRGIITIEDLRREVDAVGGFMIAAHPFRGFLTFNTVELGLTAEKAAQRPLFQLVDGLEVLNGKVTEKENGFSSRVAEALKLPATGGSDAHQASDVGIYATRFFVEIHSEEELLRALKSREYVPVAFRSEKRQSA